MCASEIQPLPNTTARGVGGAVGVQTRHWYVAYVGQNTEKMCRERLEKLGYEVFVASQNEVHHWKNGKKRQVEVVVIRTLVFVHVTESDRRAIVTLPYIKSFLVNKAAKPNDFGIRPVTIIPDRQMDMLRFMLYRADAPVRFVTTPVKIGDTIRVIRGQLQGLEGEVVEQKGVDGQFIGIRLGFLGCAVLHISLNDVERV